MRRFIIYLSLFHSILIAQQDIFVLCEGNFGFSNSTLWRIDSSLTNIYGPLIWEPGTLGDVGQSMYIYGDRLFLLMNNSHTIEVVGLPEIHYEYTIEIPSSGPREMEAAGDIGYVTCWFLNGLISINLSDYTVVDTVYLGGMPEDIIYHNGKIYTSIVMNPDWSYSQYVLAIDISTSEPFVSDTFEVVAGPTNMILHGDYLYVSSIYYDEQWNAYSGMSKIDLSTGDVTKREYGRTNILCSDIILYNNSIYKVINNGIAPLTDSLTIDEDRKIGNLSNIYSLATDGSHIFFGLSDYVAPDTVAIIDSSGNQIAQFQVGAIPGSFAFYSSPQSDVTQESDAILSNLYLKQNYPNPFNKSTTVEYLIPKDCNVLLSIYGISGKHITDLINHYLTKGIYSIQWDGRDKYGKIVNSGEYIYQLKTDNGVESKKMVFIK